MIAAGAPQKLRFAVTYCTGEDYDHPSRELLYHTPQSRGWQSPRTCKYPQEIDLTLEQPSRVRTIQLLAHEYKIPCRVEIFAGVKDPRDSGSSQVALKRLGHISFDSNERSGLQAREMKDVDVNIVASVIKFVIHRCHVNKLNIYNQVGIIAINLIGEPLAPPAGPAGLLEQGQAPMQKQPYYNKSAAVAADLNLDIHVDQHTASRIRDMQRQKELAIEAEDYDEAKRLKVSIERLKVIGQKIQQLESRKRAAVEKEDYDMAKALKVDIEKLRMAGESAAVGADAAAVRSKNPEEIFNRVLEKDRSQHVPVDRSADAAARPTMPASSFPPPPLADGPAGAAELSGDALMSPVPAPSRFSQPGPTDWGSPDNATSYISYDERPANGKGSYNVDNLAPDTVPSSTSRPPRPTHSAEEEVISAKAPAGWPDSLPQPEALTGPASGAVADLVELVGDYAGSAFGSKNWQLREAAATYIAGLVKQGKLTDRKDAFRVLVKAVVKGLKDKVANVFHSSVQLLKEVMDTFAPAVSQREVAQAAEQCVPVLLDKIGDANTRIKDAAKSAIMDLAGVKDAGLRAMTSVFLKPVKNQNAWKPVLGTVQLLQDLVPLLGISKAGDGFELGELMDYVGRALNSPNADVRSASVKVAATAHDLVGPAVRKFLPKDLNPKMKEQLDQAFGGEAPSPGPATYGRPSSATQKAAPASTTKAQKTSSRPAPPAPVPAAAPPPDSPAAYEEEIRQREQQLGPNHPEVAELCGHLAILYSQEGKAGPAQKLYERALGVYERNYGPEHPDVAHTLTDLAVLHLEQGRDAVGRPLLERALQIQEKLLGPDHPDVVAIRDVLNSDE